MSGAKAAWVAVGIAMAVLASGCRTSIDEVSELPDEMRELVTFSGFEKDAKIPRSGTYRLLNAGAEGNLAAKAAAYEPMVSSALQQVMNEYRYQLARGGEADLIVSFAIAADTRLGIGDVPSPLALERPKRGLGEKEYEAGSLIVHIYDPKGELVWRGAAYARMALDEKMSNEVRQARLLAITRALLGRFFPSRFVG